MDLLSKKEKDELYESKRAQSHFVADFIKVEISAINGTGLNRLFRLTNNVIDRAQNKYTTASLNKLLNKFTLQSAPPSVGGRQLKLKHIHFGGINPTTLIIHSNQDKRIPQNYRKYLENCFRSSLKLQSIQLKLFFRKSANPFEKKVNKLSERQVKKRQRMMRHVKKKK
jgi:GTP-binding protein